LQKKNASTSKKILLVDEKHLDKAHTSSRR